VQLGDPSLDLIRNITSPSDRTVITYRTSDGAGEYLRLAALPSFDASGFHLVATDLVPLQFGGDLPRVAAPTTVRSTIDVGELATEYLPMPWFPITVDAPGDNWRYDPRTLAVVAVGKGREGATRNQTYTTQTARLPSAERLLPTLEEAGDPGDAGLTLQLPPALPPSVRQLAQVIAGRDDADSAGVKALALVNYLRSGAFTYSTAVAQGTTLGTLEDFLLGSRTGYCEQFAGALAVMARAVGIPSRVVVGFLPGRKVGDRWEVSARNMHAWVELYFGDGVGWVPVDATPGGAVGNPSASASATASASASVTPSTAPATVEPSAPAPLPADGDDDGTGTALAWAVGLLALAGVAVGVGPRLVRAGLRSVRLRPGRDAGRAAEGAWSEVRAAAIDRGRHWPAGTTREVAAQLGAELDEPGREALLALAVTVERARYDRVVGPAPDLAAQVSQITGAFERRWAMPTAGSWWPRSVRLRRLAR
jgi:transglutaminase-like putative cysteine protease